MCISFQQKKNPFYLLNSCFYVQHCAKQFLQVKFLINCEAQWKKFESQKNLFKKRVNRVFYQELHTVKKKLKIPKITKKRYKTKIQQIWLHEPEEIIGELLTKIRRKKDSALGGSEDVRTGYRKYAETFHHFWDGTNMNQPWKIFRKITYTSLSKLLCCFAFVCTQQQ